MIVFIVILLAEEGMKKKEHIENGVFHKCDIELCERTFKSKDSLNRHKRINHQHIK